MRRLAVAMATLALVAAACGSVAAATPVPAWVPSARSLSGADRWLLAGETASRSLPADHPRVLFVGDSITQWWRRYGAATWNADFAPIGAVDDGVVGDTTSNLLYRLESGSLYGIRPRLVVTMIGTNNFHLGQRPAEIVRGIDEVLDVEHADLPGARLLVLGLFPRDHLGSPRRHEQQQVDRLLASSPAVTGGEAVYANPGAALLEPDGHLEPGVLHPDLLHPTAAGYAIVGAALSPVVHRLLEAPPVAVR